MQLPGTLQHFDRLVPDHQEHIQVRPACHKISSRRTPKQNQSTQIRRPLLVNLLHISSENIFNIFGKI
jgi:hypothetical protein